MPDTYGTVADLIYVHITLCQAKPQNSTSSQLPFPSPFDFYPQNRHPTIQYNLPLHPNSKLHLLLPLPLPSVFPELHLQLITWSYRRRELRPERFQR